MFIVTREENGQYIHESIEDKRQAKRLFTSYRNQNLPCMLVDDDAKKTILAFLCGKLIRPKTTYIFPGGLSES